MAYLSWTILIFAAGAALAWALRRQPAAAAALGPLAALAGCGLGLYAVVPALAVARSESRTLAWNLPYAAFSLRLDATSALFLAALFVIGGVAAVAAARRVAGAWEANHPGVHWLLFNLHLLLVALALLARNGVLFLCALGAAGIALLLLCERDWRAAGGGRLLMPLVTVAGLATLAAFALGADGAATGFLSWHEHPRRQTILALGLVASVMMLGWFPFSGWQAALRARMPDGPAALWPAALGGLDLYTAFRFLAAAGLSGALAWLAPLLILSGMLGCARALGGVRRSRALEDLSAWSGVYAHSLIAVSLGLGCWAALRGSYAAAFPAFAAAPLIATGHAACAALFRLAGGDLRTRAGTGRLDWLGGWRAKQPTTARLLLLAGLGCSSLPPLGVFPGLALIFIALARLARIGSEADQLPALALLAALAGLTVAALWVWRGFFSLFRRVKKGGREAAAEKPSSLLPLLLLAVLAVFLSVAPGQALRAVRPVVDVVVRAWLPAGSVDPAVPAELVAMLRAVAVGGWLAAALGGGVAALLPRGKKAHRNTPPQTAAPGPIRRWASSGLAAWQPRAGDMPFGLGPVLALLALLLAWQLWGGRG